MCKREMQSIEKILKEYYHKQTSVLLEKGSSPFGLYSEASRYESSACTCVCLRVVLVLFSYFSQYAKRKAKTKSAHMLGKCVCVHPNPPKPVCSLP